MRDFRHRPGRVFRDERIGVVGGPAQGGEVVGRSGVAEHHADVAQEAGAFDPFDRGFGEKRAERVVVQREEIPGLHREDRLAGVETGLAGDLREAVAVFRSGIEFVEPSAHVLQAIASFVEALSASKPVKVVVDGEVLEDAAGE